MLSVTCNLTKPFPFIQCKSPKHSFFLTSNLVGFSGKIVSPTNSTMRAFTKAWISRKHNDTDFIDVNSGFEHEAFVDDGFSGIRSTRDAGRLDVTMNNLSKWIVIAIFGALIILRHDGEVIWFAVGSALNVLLSLTLKQTLKQDRPSSTLSSGHGMPSSHAQFIFFAAIFFIVSNFHKMDLAAKKAKYLASQIKGNKQVGKRQTAFSNPSLPLLEVPVMKAPTKVVPKSTGATSGGQQQGDKEATPKKRTSKSKTSKKKVVEWLGLNEATTLLGGLVLASSSYFSCLRVSLHYHTMSQVGVGAMVGSIFSFFWFWLWNSFVSKAFAYSMWFGFIVVFVAFGYGLGVLLLILLHCWLNYED